MNSHEVMRATEAIGSIGAAFYFVPETIAAGKEHGLGGMRFYFLGRGGVLGNVHSDVVRSAFGYFHPALCAKLWDSSVERMEPLAAASLYIEQAHEFGRRTFSGVDAGTLEGFVSAAAKVIGGLEAASMPLFVALRSEPVPSDLPAAAMHQAMLLRELRGSAHLLALTAVGLRTDIAHAIKRPDDSATFGWDPAPEVTDEHRRLWEKAEDLTDSILAPAYDQLDDAEVDALVNGTNALAEAIAG